MHCIDAKSLVVGSWLNVDPRYPNHWFRFFRVRRHSCAACTYLSYAAYIYIYTLDAIDGENGSNLLSAAPSAEHFLDYCSTVDTLGSS